MVPLRHPRPTIADVKCQRIQFRPGDRVIVRTYTRLDYEQEKKLRRSIERWAGEAIEVLIYNGMDMEISIEQG